MYVQIIFNSFRMLSGQLLTQLTVCSLCITCMSICNFSYFPFWFCGQDLGCDCSSSWSLLTFYFYSVCLLHCSNIEGQYINCIKHF